jgi:hypothetical protein
MAYNFNGSNQFLENNTPISASPFTLSCRFNQQASATKYLIQLTGTSAVDGFFVASNELVYQFANPNYNEIRGLGTFSPGAWNHACIVCNSSTSRVAYLNGNSTSSNANSVANFSILKIATLSGSLNFNGGIAEVGIWSAALTGNEIDSLVKGMTCDKIRPQSLVFYAPLVRDLIDQKGGLTITNNNGATVANHPRIYL